MGRALVYRLTKIDVEYAAVRTALGYLETRSHLLVEDLEFEGQSLHGVRQALAGLEATYTIRLFAEFEGVLRDCWAARGGDPEEHTVNYLIDQVGLIHMDPLLRQRVHDVQHHRNSLVHQIRPKVAALSFDEARRRLAKYLDRVPDLR